MLLLEKTSSLPDPPKLAEHRSAMRSSHFAERIAKWAGDDQEKQVALVKYCRVVLKGDYELNRYAREALEELVGESE